MKVCIRSMCYGKEQLNYQYISNTILTLIFSKCAVLSTSSAFKFITQEVKALEKFNIKTKLSQL